MENQVISPEMTEEILALPEGTKLATKVIYQNQKWNVILLAKTPEGENISFNLASF